MTDGVDGTFCFFLSNFLAEITVVKDGLIREEQRKVC